MLRSLFLLLVLTSPALAQSVDPKDPPEDLSFFSGGDLTMNAAIPEAQRTLPMFLARVIGPDGVFADGSVKVAFQTFPVDQGTEVIWVSPLSRLPDGTIVGLLNNQPFFLGDWQMGDQVVFPVADIRDWSLDGPEGLLGNYSTRVIAAQPGNGHLWDILAPEAVPAEWEQAREEVRRGVNKR